MEIEELLNDFFYLNKLNHLKGIPIKTLGSPEKDLLPILIEEILGRFGLPINCGYENVLVDFINYDQIVPGLIDSVVDHLEQKGREFKERDQNLEYSESLKNQNESKPIVSDDIKEYVTSHLDFVLTEKDFEDIETGFILRWNYSSGQIVGDGDIKRSVDSYLTSIENPMDRKKMCKVVDTILDYIEIIDQSSDNR
ncbi:MAG: hypothetical protein ISS19_17805 [Bacteroidales bacterium]|nr:hypothetical protein [Bacteroidales bacterium]